MKDVNKPVITLTFTEEQYEEYKTKFKDLEKAADYYTTENRRLTDELKEAENRIDILDEENNKLIARLIANRAKYKHELEERDEMLSEFTNDIRRRDDEKAELLQKNHDMVELLSRTRKEYEEDLYLIDRARTKDKEEIRKLNNGLRKKNDQIKQLLATRKYLYKVISTMSYVSGVEYEEFADFGVIYGKTWCVEIYKIKDPHDDFEEKWYERRKKNDTSKVIEDADNGIGTTRYSSPEDMWKDLATISSGLPLKGERKVVNEVAMKLAERKEE